MHGDVESFNENDVAVKFDPEKLDFESAAVKEVLTDIHDVLASSQLP